jgi:hypothetical protein
MYLLMGMSFTLQVVFDYKAALSPILSKHIKYHNVPHFMEIKRVQGCAIFQYLNFSPPMDLGDYSELLLPKLPPEVIIPVPGNRVNENIKLLVADNFAFVNGKKAFMEHCKIETDHTKDVSQTSIDFVRHLNGCLEEIRELQMDIANKGLALATSEVQDLAWTPKFTFAQMKKMCTPSSGYICWLNATASELDEINPVVIIPDSSDDATIRVAQNMASVGKWISDTIGSGLIEVDINVLEFPGLLSGKREDCMSYFTAAKMIGPEIAFLSSIQDGVVLLDCRMYV